MPQKQTIKMKIALLFPHQLFQNNPIVGTAPIYLVETALFFNQYPFHKQKIAFHRATMKCYTDFLTKQGYQVHYIEAISEKSDPKQLLKFLAQKKITTIDYIDPTDFLLHKYLVETAKKYNITLNKTENPLFINTTHELAAFFKPNKKKFFQTSFYKNERKRLNILLEKNGSPTGGKWTYDSENRKKYPKTKIPPPISFPSKSNYYAEAVTYVNKHFSTNYGQLTEQPLYPTDFKTTKQWLTAFLEQRFHEFGHYEDAIVAEASILHHSVLTPMLNVGLLTPQYIIQQALEFATKNNVPLNSLEGFIRQIIGWREFIRGMYEAKSVEQRTKNFWGFTRKIPPSFYNGTTGILPVDKTIKKILRDGYCHHIERLMVLGNFMLLCEFDPDEVYKWFMELFIDAYDWVMVPNIYGMSQFADGGLFATKPYISGSNYLLKMSDYPKGEWQEIWDGLFWRFMHINRDFFLKNPRLGMLVRNLDRMNEEKKNKLFATAETFLAQLDTEH